VRKTKTSAEQISLPNATFMLTLRKTVTEPTPGDDHRRLLSRIGTDALDIGFRKLARRREDHLSGFAGALELQVRQETAVIVLRKDEIKLGHFVAGLLRRLRTIGRPYRHNVVGTCGNGYFVSVYNLQGRPFGRLHQIG